MALILNIADEIPKNLTIDSLEYTIDNLFISIDATEITAGESTIPLLSDTPNYTADNNILTADLISLSEILTDSYVICFTPRRFVEKVNLVFFNELTEETTIVEGTCQLLRGLTYASFILPVEESDSFELIIKDFETNQQIWKGKAFATSQTDLQNYQFVSKNNNIIKI